MSQTTIVSLTKRVSLHKRGTDFASAPRCLRCEAPARRLDRFWFGCYCHAHRGLDRLPFDWFGTKINYVKG